MGEGVDEGSGLGPLLFDLVLSQVVVVVVVSYNIVYNHPIVFFSFLFVAVFGIIFGARLGRNEMSHLLDLSSQRTESIPTALLPGRCIWGDLCSSCWRGSV